MLIMVLESFLEEALVKKDIIIEDFMVVSIITECLTWIIWRTWWQNTQLRPWYLGVIYFERWTFTVLRKWDCTKIFR